MKSQETQDRQIVNDASGWYTIKQKKRKVYYTLYTKQGLFTGKSVCDERDQFNIHRGKRLAKLRAIREMKQFKLDQLLTEINMATIYLNEESTKLIEKHYADRLKVLRMSIRKLSWKIRAEITE